MPSMSKGETATVLTEAAELVEAGWVQGVLAIDEDGDECEPTMEEAVAWCATGALNAAAPTLEAYCQAENATTLFVQSIIDEDIESIEDWNDSRASSGKEVADLFRSLASSRKPDMGENS